MEFFKKQTLPSIKRLIRNLYRKFVGGKKFYKLKDFFSELSFSTIMVTLNYENKLEKK